MQRVPAAFRSASVDVGGRRSCRLSRRDGPSTRQSSMCLLSCQAKIGDGGSHITGKVHESWTKFMTRLHINLHLPQSWSIFIVGLPGVAPLSSLISNLASAYLPPAARRFAALAEGRSAQSDRVWAPLFHHRLADRHPARSQRHHYRLSAAVFLSPVALLWVRRAGTGMVLIVLADAHPVIMGTEDRMALLVEGAFGLIVLACLEPSSTGSLSSGERSRRHSLPSSYIANLGARPKSSFPNGRSVNR